MELKNGDNEKLRHWIETIKTEPVRCDTLTEEQVWSDNQAHIWQARRFYGSPSFYPVYQWRDYYSYSPLLLLLKKGSLNLNPVVARLAETNRWNYLSNTGTLDKEIKRLGGAMT